MRRQSHRYRAVVTLAAISVATIVSNPPATWAQATQAAGWYFTPSVSLIEQWDDNVFRATSQREADFITRITPGFTGGYQSLPLTLLGKFSFDSEIYAEHPELDGPANGKRAGLETRYLPTRNLTLGLTAAYIETQTPSALNTLSNAEQARSTSTQIGAGSSVSYQLSPITSTNGSYGYTTTDSANLTTLVHHGELALSRQLTPATYGSERRAADVGTITYGVTVTEFVGISTVTSHTLLPGWTHYFTELTRMSLQAGPRYEEGAWRPEVNAEIAHEGKTIALSLAYFRTESTLTGQSGLLKTEGGRASVQWKPPIRRLTIGFAPSYATTKSEQGQTAGNQASQDLTIYSASLSLSYQFTRWLTASAGYQFTHQEQKPDNLDDNLVSLRFDIAYPIRVR